MVVSSETRATQFERHSKHHCWWVILRQTVAESTVTCRAMTYFLGAKFGQPKLLNVMFCSNIGRVPSATHTTDPRNIIFGTYSRYSYLNCSRKGWLAISGALLKEFSTNAHVTFAILCQVKPFTRYITLFQMNKRIVTQQSAVTSSIK